jgi:hypothetical protein
MGRERQQYIEFKNSLSNTAVPSVNGDVEL